MKSGLIPPEESVINHISLRSIVALFVMNNQTRAIMFSVTYRRTGHHTFSGHIIYDFFWKHHQVVVRQPQRIYSSEWNLSSLNNKSTSTYSWVSVSANILNRGNTVMNIFWSSVSSKRTGKNRNNAKHIIHVLFMSLYIELNSPITWQNHNYPLNLLKKAEVNIAEWFF